MKAQAGVEYAFIAAFVVSIVVFIAAPAFREVESAIALQSARRECVQVAWENGVEFAQLNNSLEGRTFTIEPEFFYSNGTRAEWVDPGKRPLNAIASAFHSSVEGGCVNVLNYEYCCLECCLE